MTRLSIYHCPKCNRPGNWRHGLHFEHMMICFCGGQRSTTWDPAVTQLQNYIVDRDTGDENDYKGSSDE